MESTTTHGETQVPKEINMTEPSQQILPWKCVFCRMATGWRVLRAPLCAICWEQLNDFIWVSFVQVGLLALGAINGLFFVIEEVLLFFVLIVIKHRVRPILGRITEIS
jgi:hypothetical protein